MCLKIPPRSPKESFEKETVQKMNIFQILLSQDAFPPSMTNHSFFTSSFIIICKRNTHKKQQGPLKIAAELWRKSSQLGHPGREVRLATHSGSLLLSLALEPAVLSPVCGKYAVSTLRRSYQGFGQDCLCIFSSTSEGYFLSVRELLAFLSTIDICFMPRLSFFHVLLCSPGMLNCL